MIATPSRTARRIGLPEVIAAACAIAALVIGIRWGLFLGAGPDASGYVSQADLWRRGVLTVPAPAWAIDAPWHNALWTSAPVGYRPAPDGTDLVPVYPPGLPMLMAVLQKLGGPSAGYFVVPLSGAVAIWITFLLGRRLRGPWAGAIGAVLLLSSPPFLWFIVQPMTDVVATACWGTAFLLAWGNSRRGAVASGLAASLAVLVRPNLVPLLPMVGLLAAITPTDRRPRLVGFAAAAALGPLVMALLSLHWYGSPFTSGYGTFDELFGTSHIRPNLDRYWNWLLDAQTLLFLIAPAAPLVARYAPRDRLRALLLTIGVPAIVLAFYAVYLVFDSWYYLRFLLPAFPMLLAGVGAVLTDVAARVRYVGPILALCLVAGTTYHGWTFVTAYGYFGFAENEQRFALAVSYAEGLDPRSVIVSNAYSGTLRFHARRDVLRWEIVHPTEVDEVLDYLRRRGHPLYFIGDEFEVRAFRFRFPGSRTAARLDRRLLTETKEFPEIYGFVVYDLTQP